MRNIEDYFLAIQALVITDNDTKIRFGLSHFYVKTLIDFATVIKAFLVTPPTPEILSRLTPPKQENRPVKTVTPPKQPIRGQKIEPEKIEVTENGSRRFRCGICDIGFRFQVRNYFKVHFCLFSLDLTLSQVLSTSKNLTVLQIRESQNFPYFVGNLSSIFPKFVLAIDSLKIPYFALFLPYFASF